MLITQNDIDRFWSKLNFTDHCWIYTGCSISKNNKYGVFWINGQNMPAHRFSYIIHNGFKELRPINIICHSCDNPKCVNPNHLWLGTHKDNSQDMVNKDRQSHNYGSQNGMSILDESDIQDILIDIHNGLYSNINDIVKVYPVTYAAIADMLHGKTWNHITSHLKVPLKTIRDKVIDKSSNRNTVKLTKSDVYNIRLEIRNGKSNAYLASIYSVHITTIDAIRKYKTWKNIKI